jgi:hypothetical protein
MFITPITIASIEDQKDEICSTETISFSNPTFSENGDYISVDLTDSTSSLIGNDKPKLPVVTKTYPFPFNTQISNVEVSFSNIEKEILTKPIIPAPEPQIITSVYNSKNIAIKEDAVTYNDLDIYPEKRYSYRIGTGLKDGIRMKFLTIYLHPVQYIPEGNMIYYVDSATIQIKYSPSKNPVSFPDVYDLLIITPVEFADELQPLVDYKNENEIPTIMITLDDIPEKGVDKQEDIKYYIKDAIETWGITYVLLVGSGLSGEEKFPVRYVHCSPFIYWFNPSLVGEFPSDLYYADIYDSENDFSSWNYDNDDRYFEYPADLPAVDIYPDVYLGRLACNNIDEEKTVVGKIIDYMENNKMTNRILQIGGDHHFSNDGIFEGEFQNEEVLKKLPGYTTNRLWGSLGNLKKLNIRNGFMDGVDFVDIAGHGNINIFGTSPPNNPDTTIPPRTLISPYPGFLSFDYDRFFFNNEKLPVIVYTACMCSRFTDTPNCIGWKPISKSKGGGIASFGHTTYTWGLTGINAADRYDGWNEIKIFEEMYNNKILGTCWGNCITDYINSFNIDAVDLAISPSFTLLGDPTLAIEDSKYTKIKTSSDPNVWSEDFDSYNLGQFLDGSSDDGGWNILHHDNPEYGAYIVDDQSHSLPHSVEIAGQADIIHEFTGLNSGNMTFRDWIYIPSGSDFGESYIAFLSYHFPDNYMDYIIEADCYFQVVIKFDLNNGIVVNIPYNDTLLLILDEWVELRVEIDMESDWIECYYNDKLLMGQKFTSNFWTPAYLGTNGFLNLACVALMRGKSEEDFAVYHDDMSIYHEETGLKPDLQCDGSLSFTCKAGETMSDTFTVRNIGDPGSRLEWIIYDIPEYGIDSWLLFDPVQAKLTPEDGELTVTATLKAPNDIVDYSGVIKIHAVGDYSDSCEIPITLTVKKSRELRDQLQIWLEQYSHLFPIFHRLIGL